MSTSHTLEDLRKICPRFRVLVLGRRNAGKTTILKKMTGSEDGAFEVRDKLGDLVEDSSILEPNVERGMSDIEHEITFKSNPGFVFHDSRGIEAGAESDVNSKLRIEHIHAFIARRASEIRLRDQLHAIWFCIPVDKPRVPSAEFELRFFDKGTLSVPVIAVFTKFEALVDQAYEELLDEDRSESKADDQANEMAQSNFNYSIWKAIQGTKHPPKGHVQLQKMNEDDRGCEELTNVTYKLVSDRGLADVFAMSQRNSFKVASSASFRAVMAGIEHSVWPCMSRIMMSAEVFIANGNTRQNI